MLDLDQLDFAKCGGCVTVVTQDAATGAVLMVAQADRDALTHTLQTGEMYYHSRSRGLWHKGATSGSTQRVVSLRADCDGDAVLALVESAGPACHTGHRSCFDAPSFAADAPLLALDRTIAERDQPTAPATSYTRSLLEDRNLRLKKLGEEMAELIVACADDDGARATNEAADVWYHTLVALRALGVSARGILDVLASRAGGSERAT